MPLYVNRGRPREVQAPVLEEAILEAIENAPGQSIRGFARVSRKRCSKIKNHCGANNTHFS
jgi:hypothetical protein